MLGIGEEEEPLGANPWTVLASKLLCGHQKFISLRDQDSHKNKWDKLAHMKKKTGDTSCPEPVRRVELIAREIQKKCGAMTLGKCSDGGDENLQGVNVSDGSDETPGSSIVGKPRKKRRTGANATPSKAITGYFIY